MEMSPKDKENYNHYIKECNRLGEKPLFSERTWVKYHSVDRKFYKKKIINKGENKMNNKLYFEKLEENRKLKLIRGIRELEYRAKEENVFPVPPITELYLNEFRDKKDRFDIDKISNRMEGVLLNEFRNHKDLITSNLDDIRWNDITINNDNGEVINTGYISIFSEFFNSNWKILVLNSLFIYAGINVYMYRSKKRFIIRITDKDMSEVIKKILNNINNKLGGNKDE